MQTEYKGTNGTLVLTDTGVIIKRGVRGFLLGGGKVRGDKSIPYSSIIAVQFKKASIAAGYLQLTLRGGSEAKGGIFQAITDENTITFNTWGKNKIFEEARELIEKRMHQEQGGKGHHSSADDLEKFSKLKDKGIITDEEFQAKKKQLLGM